MGLLPLDTHTGVPAAFTEAVGDTGYSWDDFVGGNYAVLPAGTPFVQLSYDPAYDVVVLTRGGFTDYLLKVGFQLLQYPGLGIVGPSWLHVSYAAESLDPTDAFRTSGISAHLYPVDGCCMGLCRDPNTGELRQSTADLFTTQEATPETYGHAMLISGTTTGTTQQWFTIDAVIAELATDDVTILNDPFVYHLTVHNLIWLSFGGFVGMVESSLGANMTPNVLTFDDVVVFLYEDTYYHTAILSVMARGTRRWLGSRKIPLAHPMQLCPVGPDSGLMIGWQTADPTSPLVAMSFTYDRARAQLLIDRVDTLKATHGYRPHWHCGYATYDSQRQAIILLSPDGEQFERYVTYNLCHPGRPASAYAAVPLSAVQAGQTTTFAVYTGTEVNPVPAPTVYLSWGEASAGLFSAPPPQQTQTAANGTGTFAVQWTSAAEGAAVTPVVYLSSYSVVPSATTAYGQLYGVEPMTILAATNTFAVSAGLSASLSATALVTAATILPGRPALQSDAVGAGTPQELVYPTSALNTPLVFELNPQLWTNVAAELLTRPLYASQRTLTQTATVQFVGHFTDLEVKLTWMGGGDRAAMSWAFFSQLYNYFVNTPDVASVGYIRWRPKDLSNHVYDILFTNLEVGGQGTIQLDTLVKAASGYVHDAVTATFRVIQEVE